MNRTETIKHIELSADLSRDAAARVMDVFEAGLKAHTGARKRVVLRGFGSFSRGLPAEKIGRNPRTGRPISYTAYHKAKGAPAVGIAALCEEIASGAQIDQAAAGRAQRAQSTHRGDDPDPCGARATIPCLENRQRRRQVQSRRAAEGGSELKRVAPQLTTPPASGSKMLPTEVSAWT